jgi:hypothetical protein
MQIDLRKYTQAIAQNQTLPVLKTRLQRDQLLISFALHFNSLNLPAITKMATAFDAKKVSYLNTSNACRETIV